LSNRVTLNRLKAEVETCESEYREVVKAVETDDPVLLGARGRVLVAYLLKLFEASEKALNTYQEYARELEKSASLNS